MGGKRPCSILVSRLIGYRGKSCFVAGSGGGGSGVESCYEHKFSVWFGFHVVGLEKAYGTFFSGVCLEIGR